MDQLAAMRAFVKVVETGNFTRASETLRMPKATLTNLIQGLEKHLQTRLLNRTTRRVVVTTDGVLYYERAVSIIADIDELDGRLSQAQTEPSGRLRVEMSGAFADWFVIPFLGEFYRKYPDIQLDIGIGDRTVDYLKENVDCALRGGEPADQSLIARRISEVGLVTCAAPKYLDKFGTPEKPEDLETGHFFVNYFMAQTGQVRPFVFRKDGREISVTGRHWIAVNDARSYVLSAAAGHGIGQLPDFMVSEELEKGSLVRVLHGWTTDTIPLYIVYPPNRHLSNKVRVFVDWLIRLLAGIQPAGQG
ncbi:LysR family transcriptional regulator [Roseibium marinum]|uniref:DNA-binding transcriptional LysR family regulator n=1 Tax=Roseibium marinum TaxID=281252 RepID=A0A2S3UTH2_9HYPH|nr:LysR family transcriptional regulator [Roseibium marinum]POF31011.1 DNA-binding transcriptional LysR family regulator [Roseibium marinum]